MENGSFPFNLFHKLRKRREDELVQFIFSLSKRFLSYKLAQMKGFDGKRRP